jgi:hypothetical protein
VSDSLPNPYAANCLNLKTIDLRSASKTSDFNTDTTKEEQILGDKAVGGIDNDEDHVPNVVSGLKA